MRFTYEHVDITKREFTYVLVVIRFIFVSENLLRIKPNRTTYRCSIHMLLMSKSTTSLTTFSFGVIYVFVVIALIFTTSLSSASASSGKIDCINEKVSCCQSKSYTSSFKKSSTFYVTHMIMLFSRWKTLKVTLLPIEELLD